MTPEKENSIKVLVADDHEIVRQGLKTIISECLDLSAVGEAENGNEVLKIVKKNLL